MINLILVALPRRLGLIFVILNQELFLSAAFIFNLLYRKKKIIINITSAIFKYMLKEFLKRSIDKNVLNIRKQVNWLVRTLYKCFNRKKKLMMVVIY
jgi:hypothetical protein